MSFQRFKIVVSSEHGYRKQIVNGNWFLQPPNVTSIMGAHLLKPIHI
ncbi:MAG: hypothetical protein K9I02_05360 [Haliscomenobacter sp.]|nr:hypothetical protein [Haliscomenobacter sp.]